VSDAGKRVHTLLTDGAIAGLSDAEREELELLLEGAPIDASYEHAAAAIELSLLGQTEELPIELEAAIVQQATRYWGFAALRPREPTLGADADATPVRRVWERSPDNIDELAVLESSLTNGRIDPAVPGEILISTDEPSGDHPAAEDQRAEQFDSEVDAQLDALEQRPVARERHALEDDDDDELDDDDDELDDDDDDDEREPVEAPPRKRKRSHSKPAKQARAPEESQARPLPRDNKIARWASYVSAIAALAILIVALWLLAQRDAAPDPDELTEQIEASSDKLEWSFVAKPDKLVGEGAGGSILWSSDLQSGVMRVRGLAANDPTVEQYQLWIVDRKREGPPVDGGVFDVPAGQDELHLVIDAKLLIGDPAAFVITVERPGGVVVSSQDRVAMVAAPG
jgi:anti-sigma-K factor RskA